jgi:hypothetical protein
METAINAIISATEHPFMVLGITVTTYIAYKLAKGA